MNSVHVVDQWLYLDSPRLRCEAMAQDWVGIPADCCPLISEDIAAAFREEIAPNGAVAAEDVTAAVASVAHFFAVEVEIKSQLEKPPALRLPCVLLWQNTKDHVFLLRNASWMYNPIHVTS